MCVRLATNSHDPQSTQEGGSSRRRPGFPCAASGRGPSRAGFLFEARAPRAPRAPRPARPAPRAPRALFSLSPMNPSDARGGGSAALLRVLLGLCLAATSHGTVRCGKGKYGQEKYLHVYVRSQIDKCPGSGALRPAPDWADTASGSKGQAWLCMRTSTSLDAIGGDSQCSDSAGYTGLSNRGSRNDSPVGGTAPWRRAGGKNASPSWKVRRRF